MKSLLRSLLIPSEYTGKHLALAKQIKPAVMPKKEVNNIKKMETESRVHLFCQMPENSMGKRKQKG